MRHIRRCLKGKLVLQIGLMALIFYAFGCASQPSAPPTSQADAGDRVSTETQQLLNIQVVDQDDIMGIYLVGSNSMTYTAFKAIDPLRLVLDLPNTETEIESSPLAVENEIIGKIETMMLAQEPQPMTRVEIGLNQETPYEIVQEKNQIVVQFQQTAAVVETEPTPEAAGVFFQTETTPEMGAAATAAASGEKSRPAGKITAIQPITYGEELKVYIIGDGSITKYNVFTLTDPARVVLDLMGVELAAGKANVPPSDPLVKGIRMGTHPNKVRIVFDLIPAAGLPYHLTSVGDRLVVTFEPGDGFPATPPIVVEQVAAPAEPAVPPKRVAPPAEAARILSIDFTLLQSNKSRLTVAANRPLEPEVQITGANSMSMVFTNAKLPKHLERHIDTGQFASAVNVIFPRPMQGVPGTVEFYIEMREMVPYHIATEGNAVYLDFDRSTLPPVEPIKLGRPAAVVEERGPEIPAPAPEEVAPPPAPEPMVGPAPPTAVEVGEGMEPAAAEEMAVAEKVPVIEAAGPRVSPEGPKVYTGQKISLDLQEVDIRNVLRLLADVTGKNIVVEPGVSGKVTLKVDNVPWDQVLELILKINELDHVMEGNVLRIATAAKLKAEFERQREAVEAQKELMAAARDLGEISTEYLQVNYADVGDISAQIDNIKSEKGTISVDNRTNLIIYSDFPKRIETAKEILARLDKATKQVMIESRIVSANTNFTRNLGVSWNASYTNNSLNNRLSSADNSNTLDFSVLAPTSAVGTFGLNLARNLGVNNLFELDMTLDALEQAGEGRVISSPRIFTLDHVQAMIQQGDQIPYPQRTEEGTISTAFAPATLSLTVTPHITPDGKVRLEVLAKKDEADFSRTVQDVPAIRTQEAQTELLVNDGDTIVIGGIVIQDYSWSEERVPFLWRIPILGWLFKNRQVNDEKTELLIFLSPSIVVDQQLSRK
ncbi:MAG: type IV pilus secretin PilQ [Syntrophobacterales bacterium]